MPAKHRIIPIIPECPRVITITGKIFRSYPVGRQSFSRAFQGEVLSLIITAENPLPDNIKVNLVTTMNSVDDNLLNSIPFSVKEDRSLECKLIPEQPGLHYFHAEFSLDNGITWIRDNVADAWVLIDPPHIDGLRLYTVIPNVSGAITDWKADLTRIKEMGFNAVHLLPITTLDSSESPYSAHDLFDIDESYLDPNSEKDGLSQLEEYVEEARKLNIRLCFDVVLNHVGVNSKIAQIAPDWIVPDQNQPDGFHRAGYWSEHGWSIWNDLILINYEHPSLEIRKEIWDYMSDYALFWAKYANDTGGFVRFDNLHSSEPDFVKFLTTALHSEYPEVGLLAEFFTDETTLLHTGPQWGLNLHLATPWNFKFVPQLREYLFYIHRVSSHIRYYMPVTSHDSGVPAQEFGNAESTIPRYVAAALLGTGATGITQGVEFALTEKINFIGRQKKIFFPEIARFGEFIMMVNKIQEVNPAFRSGDNCIFVDNDHEAIIAAFRHETGTDNEGFLVVCNFDIMHSQKITVNLSPYIPNKGFMECPELISGEILKYNNSQLDLNLQPSSALVLKFPKNN